MEGDIPHPRHPYLTRFECRLAIGKTEAGGKGWLRPPTEVLCPDADASKSWISLWLPWPTAWLLSTWMASSKWSSILFCLEEKREGKKVKSEPLGNGASCEKIAKGLYALGLT